MSPVLILIGMFVLASHQKAAAPQASFGPNLARVYAHTAEGGNADELAARRESVKDLSRALAGKQRHLLLVNDEDKADVVLEVIDRGVTIPKVVIGLGPRPGQPPLPGEAPVRAVHLRVKLTCCREAVVLTNKNTAIESNGGWKSAADEIARQVDKWIADHIDQIIAAR
jgi:hypothetical protein